MAEIKKNLLKLIQESPSLDSVEKEHWLIIAPSLSDDQLDSLERILVEEKTKLAELTLKFENAKLALERDEIYSVIELISSI
jgi:hypothetical protein